MVQYLVWGWVQRASSVREGEANGLPDNSLVPGNSLDSTVCDKQNNVNKYKGCMIYCSCHAAKEIFNYYKIERSIREKKYVSLQKNVQIQR